MTWGPSLVLGAPCSGARVLRGPVIILNLCPSPGEVDGTMNLWTAPSAQSRGDGLPEATCYIPGQLSGLKPPGSVDADRTPLMREF